MILSFPIRIIALCAIALVGAISLAMPAQTATLTTIHVGTKANDDTTALLYAQQSGMFTAAGLDVQIEKSAANGQTISDAVLSGTYDIGKSSTLPLIQAHVKNIPFTIVAPAAVYESNEPYGGLCVQKDSPIRGLTDLKNLKTEAIGLSTLGDMGQLAIYKALGDAGRDAKGVRFTEIPQDAAPAAVEAGRVSGAECQYPVLTEALASNKIRLVPIYSMFGSDWVLTAWFTSKDYASKHPEVVKAFARVLADAARYTNAHHEVTAPMLSAFSGVPLDAVQHTPRVAIGTTMSAASLQSVIDAAAKYGAIPHSFSAQEIIDPTVIVK